MPGQVEQLGITPVIEDEGWAGYQHFVDPTRQPFNTLTFPSQNCSMPSFDKIVPDLGKKLLGQEYTENLGIIGNKEKFTNLSGDELEVRVSPSELELRIDTITGVFKIGETVSDGTTNAIGIIVSKTIIDPASQQLILKNISGKFVKTHVITGLTSGAVGTIYLDNTNRGDIIEVLYTDINPLDPNVSLLNKPHWYTISELVNNPYPLGLHRYSFDQWLDTNLNPAKNLNVPRLIWVNGNNKIYSWIGAIAPIVDVSGVHISVDVGVLPIRFIVGGPFQLGETITGGTSGATAVIGNSSDLLNVFKLINIAGGPFVAGETVTGGTSGATAVAVSYTAPTKTWASLGFIDPATSGFANDAQVRINGIIRVISAGWATPTATFSPTTPTVHVGDIGFSTIRQDDHTTSALIPDMPFDFCRQTKNYMYYGNWKSRQLYQSNAFNKDDNKIIITNSSLNDLGLGTAPFTGTVFMSVQILISATGAPDSFQFKINDGPPSAPIAITGALQVITGALGLSIFFGNTTGHTLGDSWTINMYPSVSNAWLNFSYNLPVRNPGEGYIYRLPSNFWTMDIQEDKLYINTKYGEWSILDTILSSDLVSETITLLPLKQSGALKVIDPWMTGHMEDNLVFITLDKALMNMGRQTFLQEPQDGYMSDPVKFDFLPCSFVGGGIRYIGKRLYITSPEQGIMHCFDVAKKYWQPPKTFPEMGIPSIVGNELIVHSNVRNQTFTMFKIVSDNGQAYPMIAKTPFNAYFKLIARKRIPARWDSKFSSLSFIEGYITGNPELNFTVFQGVNDVVGVSHIVVPVISNNSSDKASIGAGSLATHPLGDDLSKDGEYFNEIFDKFKPILSYYFAALQMSCVSKNHSYSILAMGINMSFAPNGNTALYGDRSID